MKRILIKDTTREEREALILEALTSCAGGGCENCSGCGVFGAGDAFEMYRPYIEGKKEIAEISAAFSATYIQGS